MGKGSERHERGERKKRDERKGKLTMKRKYSSPSSSPSSSSSASQSLRVSAKGERSKERKERFKVPYELVCKDCECIVAEGVEVNAIKKLVGKVWNYKFKCPFCRNKIVMERVSGEDQYIEVEGANFDWNAWKKSRSKSILESVGSSSTDNCNIFDVFEFALWELDPRTGMPLRLV